MLKSSKIAVLLLALLLIPLASPFAQSLPHRAPLANMTRKKKALLLGGAALLYYLYRKHQANQPAVQSGSTVASRSAQLYRSKNGGVYYRDAQGKAIWLTVPQRPMALDAEDVQRYAPDYRRYRGPAPSAPRSYRTQPFSDFDSSLLRSALRN